MSENRQIVHRRIALLSLVICVATLPFSIKLCHLAIILFVVNWLFEGKWRDKLTIINQSLMLQLFVAYFCLLLLGLLFSENLSTGWFSLEKKLFLFILPVALGTTSVKFTNWEIRNLLFVFVGACFAATVYCIFHSWQEANLVLAGEHKLNPYLSGSEYFDLHPLASDKWVLFSYVSLSAGINLHPTYLSLFLASSIIILLNEIPAIRSGLRKKAAFLLIVYFSVFIIFLSSRIMILAVGLIFLFVMGRCALQKHRSSAFMAMGAALLFCALLLLNPVSRYRSLEEIDTSTFRVDPGSNYTTATQIRFSLWWMAMKSLRHWNPLVGYGTGDTERAMSKTSDEVRITNSIRSVDPHNQFLYTLLANGAPALIVLLMILGLPVYLGWMQNDFLLLGFSFLFILLCMTESALELQKGIVFYSVVSGVFLFQRNSFQNFYINFKSVLRVGR